MGQQTTNAVFLAEPSPGGFGFSEYAIAGAYGTPIVCHFDRIECLLVSTLLPLHNDV